MIDIRPVREGFEYQTVADCLGAMQRFGIFRAKKGLDITAREIVQVSRKKGAENPRALNILNRLTAADFNRIPGCSRMYALFWQALGLPPYDPPYDRVTVHGEDGDETLYTSLELDNDEVDLTKFSHPQTKTWLTQILSELPLDPHPTSEEDFVVLQQLGAELEYPLLKNPWDYLVEVGGSAAKDERPINRRTLIGKCTPELLARYLIRADIALLCEVLRGNQVQITELDLFQVKLTQEQVDQLFAALSENTTIQVLNFRGVRGGPFHFPFKLLGDNRTISRVNLRGHRFDSNDDIFRGIVTLTALIELDDPRGGEDIPVGFPEPECPDVYREELLGMLPLFPANLVAELLLHVDPELLSQLLEHNTIGVTRICLSGTGMLPPQLLLLLLAIDLNKTVVEFDGTGAFPLPEYDGHRLEALLRVKSQLEDQNFDNANLPQLLQFIERTIQELSVPAATSTMDTMLGTLVKISGPLTQGEFQALQQKLQSHDWGKAVEFKYTEANRQGLCFYYPRVIFPHNTTLETVKLPRRAESRCKHTKKELFKNEH